ncbi:Casein kinase ii, beta subunit, partial [Globisporangium splendens]
MWHSVHARIMLRINIFSFFSLFLCVCLQLFASAAKELKVGQMVHLSNFNLFDSMSALELMDPKMDSGMLINGAVPQPIGARMKNGSIALSFTSARDVLATIDELFRCESGWFNGQPLQQTLLTSVYMHKEPINALLSQLVSFDDLIARTDIEEVLQRKLTAKTTAETLLLVMNTVCLVMLKTDIIVRDVVVRGDIYEEEDFSPANGFDIGILEAFSYDAVQALLRFTEQRLEAVLVEQKAAASSKKSSKKKGSKKAAAATSESSSNSGGYEGLHQSARIGSLICEALLRRVRLRRALFEALAGLYCTSCDCKKQGTAEGPSLDLQRAQDQFQQTKELLAGLETEQLELDQECFSGKPFGVDKTISRLLLSGSPPRDIKIPSLDDAIAIQKKLMDQLMTACSPAEWSSMEELRIFLSDFSRQQPNIIARSYVLVRSILWQLICLFLYANQKIYAKYSFTEWLSASMVMNGVPSVLMSTQEGVLFSTRVIETLYESLKLYLHNRSRQRARIEYLLEEWSVLQLEAAGIDDKFTTEMAIPKTAYPRYFTAWTLEQAVLLMIHYILLGFELDLYAPSEYGTIYWYLDYLHGSRLQNLNVTWQFVEKMKQLMPVRKPSAPKAPETDAPAPASSSTSETSEPDAKTLSKKSKHGKSKKSPATAPNAAAAAASGPVKDVDPTKVRFLREINYNEMQRSVMRAYFQLFSALEREQLVQAVTPTYSSTLIRFEHRFAAFQSIHFPAALTHDDYLKNSDFSPYKVDLIYKSAEECFKVGRAHGEELLTSDDINAGTSSSSSCTGSHVSVIHGAEVEALMKVAISNSVALLRRDQSSQATGSASKQQHKKVQKNGAATAAAAPSAAAVAATAQLDFSVHPHFPVVVFPERKA